jgi:pimeloyl-ACP methyl ester carboxylesterase
VPTLYIHGEQDCCIGVEIIKNFSICTLSAFGSRAVFIPEAGHFPHLEQPDYFNKEVLKVLSEIAVENND